MVQTLISQVHVSRSGRRRLGAHQGADAGVRRRRGQPCRYREELPGPDEVHRRHDSRTATARLLLLPGLGHVPHMEAPDKTYPPLLAFLKEGLATSEPRFEIVKALQRPARRNSTSASRPSARTASPRPLVRRSRGRLGSGRGKSSPASSRRAMLSVTRRANMNVEVQIRIVQIVASNSSVSLARVDHPAVAFVDADVGDDRLPFAGREKHQVAALKPPRRLAEVRLVDGSARQVDAEARIDVLRQARTVERLRTFGAPLVGAADQARGQIDDIVGRGRVRWR